MLFSQYKECEEVVVEHRAMKERERLKAEQEERERKAVTKVLQGEGGSGSLTQLESCQLLIILVVSHPDPPYNTGFETHCGWECTVPVLIARI